MTVGERIQQRRKELDMSADDLAALLGINRATIYRYESEEIQKIPIAKLLPLATALKTTPEYLMGWTKNDEPVEPALPVLALDDLTEAEIRELLAYKQFIIQKRGL